MPYCPECGGRLNWDRRFRYYICQSCGLTYTDVELDEAMDRLYRSREKDDEKSRWQKEYLEWWFKEKKDKR